MRRSLFALALAATVAGCVQTSEMPLAENIVLIQGSGISGGWIADMVVADQLPKQTLQRAAKATLSRGYTHFRLDVPSTSSRQVGTSPMHGQVMGNMVTVSGGNPINQTTTGVMVTMYRAGDPGARGALNARAILAELK